MEALLPKSKSDTIEYTIAYLIIKVIFALCYEIYALGFSTDLFYTFITVALFRLWIAFIIIL